MRADAFRRDPCIGRHCANDLEQAHPAEMWLTAREEPQCAAGSDLKPSRDCVMSARRNRHEPFLRALAADHQERLPRANGGPREADELGCPQSGAVEQLQEGKVANGNGLAARGALFCSLEHSADIAGLEDARQRSFKAWTRKCLGRIILPQSVIHEEAEEAAKCSGTARHGRGSKIGPFSTEPG